MMKNLKGFIKMFHNVKARKQISFLKDDIDLYASRLVYDLKLSKGYKNYYYTRKFLKIYGGSDCFRYVLYLRLDPFYV